MTAISAPINAMAQNRPQSARQILSFTLDRRRFAIDVGPVREVIQLPQTTPMPGAPDDVMGVLDLRGQAVPVVDLQARLGRGAAPLTPRSCVIIVGRNDGGRVGLLVEAVSEVLDLEPDALQAAPAMPASSVSHLYQGILRRDAEFTWILDPIAATDLTLNSPALAADWPTAPVAR